ncbi:hypothetical protein GSI_06120 [Ganoderma sinense ZZ0214-1]|uniref:Uncharacterized protein n=1 Tax=Ganoderma sinense ZZ0214-1 TaxID=1077348 RepID=A0A2G8SCD1_9APHY|nr:hypothetical protein GSI_06120 [Ganoderma sinense ZZ0214-1]
MRPTPRASSSWCSRYDAARELMGGKTGYATSLSLSREDDAGGVGYGCGFGEGVELSESGDGLRRVVSVEFDNVGETVGSRDDADADAADGDGERKRPANGGSLNCSSPDVRSGYSELLLPSAVDDDARDDAADAVRRAGRPRCTTPPSFGSMGSGRVPSAEDELDGPGPEPGPALLRGIIVRICFVP